MEIFIDLSNTLAKINKENKECYISPHILQLTRITEYSSTIIDNIYGNNKSKTEYLLISFFPALKLYFIMEVSRL